MTRRDFYRMIDEILEVEPGTITGGEQLNALEAWDSLSVLQVIAAADKKLGVNLTAQQLAECATVDAMLNLLAGRIED